MPDLASPAADAMWAVSASPVLTAAPHRIGTVSLVVRDLDAVSRFYEDAIGLKVLERFGGTARLGTGSIVLLELVHDPAARRRAPREAGLFHTAFLLPSRADLGAWIASPRRGGSLSTALSTMPSARPSTSPIPKATASRSTPTAQRTNGPSPRRVTTCRATRWTFRRCSRRRAVAAGTASPMAGSSVTCIFRSARSHRPRPSMETSSALYRPTVLRHDPALMRP